MGAYYVGSMKDTQSTPRILETAASRVGTGYSYEMPFGGGDSVAFFSPQYLSHRPNFRVNPWPSTAEASAQRSHPEHFCTVADPRPRGLCRWMERIDCFHRRRRYV